MKMSMLISRLFLLFITVNTFAQKKELYKLNANLIQVIEANKSLHLNYEIIMVSGEKSQVVDTMSSHYYKKTNSIFKMEMGDLQTVLRNQKSMLKVDHVNKIMFYGTDTNSVAGDLLLLEQLNSIVDTAKSIKKYSSENTTTYTLLFEEKFTYKSIQLEYSSANNLLKSMHAVFNQFEGQQFKSMHINYHNWDFMWEDKNNTLGLDRFLTKINGDFQPSYLYTNYKLVSIN